MAPWRSGATHIEEKTLNPAVVIYFASAGISPILKSEFGRVEALSPNTRIIVISDATGSDEINQVIGYGARGYIPTSMPYSLAVEAVRFVEAGGIFVPAVGNLLASGGSHDPRATAKTLTEQQMKVVEAVGHGFANKQIAYRLNMSENTVKVHLRHIMKKLNVRNRTQIAIWTRTRRERVCLHRGGCLGTTDSWWRSASEPYSPREPNFVCGYQT